MNNNLNIKIVLATLFVIANLFPLKAQLDTSQEYDFIGYNIYRNNEKINTAPILTNSFIDSVPSDGTFEYNVSAVYEEGESGYSNTEMAIIDYTARERNYVVIEEGTGIRCPACPAAANGIHDLYESGAKIVTIAYHTASFSSGTSYPNSGSAYRLNFYGIEAFPTVVFDGIEDIVGGGNASSSLYGYYKPIYEERIQNPSRFSLAVSGEITNGEYKARVVAEKVGENNSTNLNLMAVLIENDIPEEWMGMSDLQYVARDFFPSPNGTLLNFEQDSFQEVDLNVDIDPALVTENCKLVVFIQDFTTKEIHQATEIAIKDFIVSKSENKKATLTTLPAPFNLEADYSISNSEINLKWELLEPNWLQWDNGINSMGFGNEYLPVNFEVAARWDSMDVAHLEGMMISEVGFFPCAEWCNYSIRVWQGSKDSLTLLVDQPVDLVEINKWNEVKLNEPVTIDISKELWVGYLNENLLPNLSAGVDEGPVVSNKGDLYRVDDSDWNNLGETTSNNWNIRFYIEPSTTAINDKTYLKDFTVYPNPAKSLVNIQATTDISEILLINTTGGLVYKAHPNTKDYKLNIDGMRAGVYYISLKTTLGQRTQMIIVE